MSSENQRGKSEVAELRMKIEEECYTIKLIRESHRITARHDFIEARTRNLDHHTEKLGSLIGAEAAQLEMHQTYSRIMEEVEETLYLVFGSDSTHTEVTYTYALSAEEAATNIAGWAREHPELRIQEIRPFPGGFTISAHTWLPGKRKREIRRS